MRTALFAIIVAFLAVYVLPLGVRPLFCPDGTRYAEIPREMIESGDWVVPRLNGLRYFEKPVLGYWLTAASLRCFGENAFALRFPSAVAAGLSALWVFFLLRRFAGGPSAGLLAAAALLTCVLVFAVGTINVLDNVFSMFLTGAMVCFFFAFMESDRRRRAALLALFGALCGLAFLTKGFLALVVPALAVMPFLLWQRRAKDLLKIAWLPILTAAAVVLPWAVMVHLREPDFWHSFLWKEHIQRFMSPGKGQHAEPLWYYVPIFIAGAAPWTALLASQLRGLRDNGFRDPLVRFALCWLVCPFFFFSVCRGKLPTYILPCFPPYVILAAIGLHEYLRSGRRKALAAGAILSAVLASAAALLVLLTRVVDWGIPPIFGRSETWKAAVFIVALLAWAALSILAMRIAEPSRKLALWSAAPLIFMFATHFAVPDGRATTNVPGPLLMSHAARVGPNTALVSDNNLVTAVCWFYKRDDVYLLCRAGEHAQGLSYDDSRSRLLDLERFSQLVAGGRDVVLVISRGRYTEYTPRLPKPTYLDVREELVLARFRGSVSRSRTELSGTEQRVLERTTED